MSFADLSPRESQIVRQVASGLAAKAIAADFGISVHTVRNHLKSVYRKTGVQSKAELISIYIGSDEVRRLRAATEVFDSPLTEDFLKAVKREAAHQVKRWGPVHDAMKSPGDWLWLIAHLATKALSAQLAGDRKKALHHTVSSAAALMNWHGAMTETMPEEV